MARSRPKTWLVLLLIPVALFIALVPVRWLYVKATAVPLHPKPEETPSVTETAPAERWKAAVQESRELVRQSLTERNLPGVSVAVGVRGDIVWEEGFGFSDIDRKIPVTPKTRFRIGSASVVLTSAAAGLLLEQGKLKLDEEIQTYVPEFGKRQWPVTLRQVMSHTGGIPNDRGDEGPLFSERCDRPVEGVGFFTDDKLRFKPGSEYRFSNYGWILVSAAVEVASGKPFLTFMKEQVFDPLGMRDTIAEPSIASVSEIPGRASIYFPMLWGDPKYGVDPMRDLNYSCYSGASVFLSTPSDLVRFGMGIHGSKLLKPETVKLLQTSQKLDDGKETGYGLGWDLETISLAGKQTNIVGHDGESLGGMVSTLMTLPEQGIVIAVVSNISYSDTFSIAERIAEEFVERISPSPR